MRVCIKCQTEQPIDNFSFRNKGKGLRHQRCKDCFCLSSKEHYTQNKEDYVRRANARVYSHRETNRLNLIQYLLKEKCIDCGETDILVLEFDHTENNKSANVSHLALIGKPWGLVEQEIRKCDVVCSNCHARRTARRSNNYKWKYLVSLAGVKPAPV